MKRTLLIILIATSILAGGGYLFYTTSPISILHNEGLTYFEPSELPEGISIARKTLFINDWSKTSHIAYIALSFRKVDNVYSIDERKVTTTTDLSSTTTVLETYSPTSRLPSCRQLTSPQKQSYRLCHWIDYGSYSVYEMRFVKDTTCIVVRMNTELSRTLEIGELDMFIDSFERSIGQDLTVVRTTGP